MLGLAFGSFLNVCIYRIPQKMSILSPPSHCPNCATLIKFYDNIPVLSYLLLAGKCRACGAPISPRYPLTELTTGFLFLSMYLRFGVSARLLAALFFAFVILLAGLIDLEWQIIPNAVIFPGLGLSLALVVVELAFHPGVLPLPGRPSALNSLAGLLLSGGLLLLIALTAPLFFKKEGMGMGDVKLAAFIGIFLGWFVLVALFFGFLLGGLAGLLLVLMKKKGAKDLISFGPFLALGGLIALFYGEQLFELYLGIWH
jgi:leader peptidase (prepilin peptidase)/N-methyltransferase